nr:hypothetical protein BaRGS_026443 [Batillaria attramentaria]
MKRSSEASALNQTDARRKHTPKYVSTYKTIHIYVIDAVSVKAAVNVATIVIQSVQKMIRRPRVRKRVFRVMRSSWKYLRRGLGGYATGVALSSLFLWGASFQESFREASRRP